MTLALSGKSRKRQGLLGLLAVLAIALAMTAGASLRNGGSAEAATSTIGVASAQCFNSSATDDDPNPPGACNNNANASQLNDLGTADSGRVNLETDDSGPSQGDDDLRVTFDLSSLAGATINSASIKVWSKKAGGNDNDRLYAGDNQSSHRYGYQLRGTPATYTDPDIKADVQAKAGGSMNVWFELDCRPNSNDCGALIDKIALEVDYTFNTITIVATKVVCLAESDLPNWSGNASVRPIGATTASSFVAASNGRCWIDPAWQFQWAPANTSNPGNNTPLAGSPWTTFTGTTPVPIVGTTAPHVWVREQGPADPFIPFSASQSDDISAELWCSADVLNYDNFERIEDTHSGKQVTAGNTYYCVGFNAYKSGTLEIKKVNDGGDQTDEFSGAVTGPVPAANTVFSGLTPAAPIQITGPVGQWTVAEDDPASVGQGYVVIGYSVGSDCNGPTQEDPITVQVTEDQTTTVCIYNAPASTPTILKQAAGYNVNDDRASWTITVNNNVANAIARTVTIFDEGERLDGVIGGTCSAAIGSTIPAGGISCTVPAGNVLVVTVSRANETTAQACEPGTVNDTASVVDERLGTLPGVNSADVQIPGDDDLCPSTVTVQKFFDTDDSNTITAGDTLVNGWGMSISCTNGFVADGTTGSNGQGTVVFTIPQGPYPVTCTVTEGTLLLVETVIGPVLETTLDQPGSALVQFLNDPTELPPPPPPGNEGPVPQQNPQIPQPTEEPQEPEPTATPTEEPTEAPTVEPTVEPQEPSPTPAPPVAGSGVATGESRGNGMMLALAGLLALTGAAGVLALARRNRA